MQILILSYNYSIIYINMLCFIFSVKPTIDRSRFGDDSNVAQTGFKVVNFFKEKSLNQYKKD